jgi:cation diffusion facilitator CzcD-associated flavoprotein CzcO
MGEQVRAVSAPSVDVAIIGAGPYGLSLASQLSKRRVEHRIFGPPMDTWRKMSPGMHLKSVGFATSLITPDRHPTLPEYCQSRGEEDHEPIPIATFADYGEAVQKQFVSHLEEVLVSDLRHEGGRFHLRLETGEVLTSRRVVVAIGLSYFDRIPAPFDTLPSDLVCHTAQKGDFSGFKGRNVTVIGGGQSALQAAALLHEHQATVQVFARQDVHWGQKGLPESERSLLERIRVPMSVLGHGRDNWYLQHLPWYQHALPDDRRLRFLHTHLGPGGAWWLRDRVEGLVPIHTKTAIVAASAEGSGVRMTVVGAEGTRDVLTDSIVLGTGYDVDVNRIEFIDEGLARRVRRLERAPALNRHFESSVPGLYFVGPSAAASFGPLFRFVAGSRYAVPLLTRHLAGRWRRPSNGGREGAYNTPATQVVPATLGDR